jgi:hypothetical protein
MSQRRTTSQMSINSSTRDGVGGLSLFIGIVDNGYITKIIIDMQV